MSNGCEITCRRWRAYGFNRVQHLDPCPNAPAGVCTGCGYGIAAGEDDEHTLCAAA
jgi:hypothetical protein